MLFFKNILNGVLWKCLTELIYFSSRSLTSYVRGTYLVLRMPPRPPPKSSSMQFLDSLDRPLTFYSEDEMPLTAAIPPKVKL
jgi:hypothetical protein